VASYVYFIFVYSNKVGEKEFTACNEVCYFAIGGGQSSRQVKNE